MYHFSSLHVPGSCVHRTSKIGTQRGIDPPSTLNNLHPKRSRSSDTHTQSAANTNIDVFSTSPQSQSSFSYTDSVGVPYFGEQSQRSGSFGQNHGQSGRDGSSSRIGGGVIMEEREGDANGQGELAPFTS